MYEKITKRLIDDACSDLEFYDRHGFLPKRKKKITLTIDNDIYMKIKLKKNKSNFINNILKENIYK